MGIGPRPDSRLPTEKEFHGDERLELGEEELITAYRYLYDYKSVPDQIGAASARVGVSHPRLR